MVHTVELLSIYCNASVLLGIVMLKKDCVHLQIGSYSLDSCSNFLQDLYISFRAGCFSSWQKINTSKSLGTPEDVGHDFYR